MTPLSRNAGGLRFAEVAPESFQEFYTEVRKHVNDLSLPTLVTALDTDHRAALRSALAGRWPPTLRYDWEIVGFEIARNSASHLMERTSTPRDREELLWRLLRLAASPYFLLGADRQGLPIRYSVSTPWDSRTATECGVSTCGATTRASRPSAGEQRWSTGGTQRLEPLKAMLRSVGVTENSQGFPKPRSISTLLTTTWPATS